MKLTLIDLQECRFLLDPYESMEINSVCQRRRCVLQALSDAHLLNPNMQIIAATVWIDLQESTID